MKKYDETQFINNLLAKANYINVDIFNKVKQVLIDADVIENNCSGNRMFIKGKNNMTLNELVKIEQIIGEEIIKIPTDKEWKQINRKRKLEQINKKYKK